MKARVAANLSIIELGKHISLDDAAGESIGIERIGERGVSRLFSALETAMGEGRTDLYYEDVYSELIARAELDALAVDVGDLPWTEVDTYDDLERARSLVQSTSVP